MTDKEKIRAYVKRLQKPEGYGDYWKGYDSALNDILSFIDSLQEEPVSEDLEEASQKYANNEECKDTLEELGIECAFKAGAQWQKAKDEYITDDLGEYINGLSKQFPEVSFAKLSKITVRVAKWQKEQMKEALRTEYEKGRHDALEEMMKSTTEAT